MTKHASHSTYRAALAAIAVSFTTPYVMAKPLPPSTPGWDPDPCAWKAEGETWVSTGAGFAVAPGKRGTTVEIKARVTPISTDDPEWAGIELSIFDNLDRYWHLALLKKPNSQGAVHNFELKRQFGGNWTDGEGFKTEINKRSGSWEWGKPYDMTLRLWPDGVEGVIVDATSGKEIYRRKYVRPADAPASLNPGVGHPALRVTGVSTVARVEAVDAEVSGEISDDPVEPYPLYEPVGPETGVQGKATGFFHMEKIDGLDWAIDPMGRGTILVGTDWCNPRGSHCAALGYAPYGRFVKEHYASTEEWAVETANRLGSWGFTFLPCGGDDSLFYRTLAHANAADRLYFSHRLCMGDENWRIAEYRRAPCTAFPNVFHPDFEAACDWWARYRCAAYKDDPWLVGYFIDNELAWWGEVNANKATGIWDAVMKKSPSHPARKALVEYLAGRKPTPEIKLGFLRLVAERYFSVTTAAIRRYDPNHMILGCRFAGGPNGVHPIVMETAGKYCDIVSFNHYPWADLDRNVVVDSRANPVPVVDLYSEAHNNAKRPLLLTEWSFPAIDAGMPCTHGAGQRFKTQAERVEATALFAKTLLSLPFFAGYSYFRWLDQPPLGISKYFPENTNYGLVSERGVPYANLVGAFSEIHGNALFWRKSPPPEVRPAPQETVVSERERYVQEAADRAAASPAPVEFVRDGDSWSLDNGKVRLEGRVGSSSMIDKIAYGGAAPVGRWGALLQWDDHGTPVWTDISSVTDVSEPVRDEASGLVSVDVRAIGKEAGTAFAFTHRISLAPGADEALAEIVSLENRGAEPITVLCLFMRPFALQSTPEKAETVPNLWKAPVEGWWTLSDGSRFGVLSRDPGAVKFTLWYRDEDNTQHPDVRFMENGPRFDLAGGATFRPSIPMGARVALRAK